MTVRYRWKLLRAGAFKLDAGSMFGLVPRVVWSRTVPIDERGRMQVQHNCLLLERDGEASLTAPAAPTAPTSPTVTSAVGAGIAPSLGLPSPKLVLIETGTGDKMDAKNKDIFALEDRSILTALHEVDCRAEDVGAVVVTHLHFDHAGGLTRLAKPGETPDWTGPGAAGEVRVKVSFPNAPVYVQAREWRDALDNTSVMTRTYFRDHLEPMKERIRTIDSARPFPIGYTPKRDETPPAPVELRMTEVLPGVFVFLVPGHTWGQQAIGFTDTDGRFVVFTPDVMPTVHHLGATYSLGYDVEPYTSMVSRRWFLEAAAAGDWTVVLDHEPGNPVQRVKPDGKGWFALEGV